MILEATIWVGQTPPSLNQQGTSRNAGQKWHRLKKEWEADLANLMAAERFPKNLDRVEAHVELSFTVGRDRDEGNFRSLLEKALGDALQVGGHIANDTPDEFEIKSFAFVKGSPRTTIRLVGMVTER